MPRTCTICSHGERAAIDTALVAGESYRHIASHYGVSYKAVERHKAHIPAAIVQAHEALEEAQALDVVKQLKEINGAALAVLTTAKKAGDADTQLKAIDRIHRQIELQAKLLGDLDERPQINVLVMPEWLAVRSAILAALTPFPEARQAVVSAVARVGASEGSASA